MQVFIKKIKSKILVENEGRRNDIARKNIFSSFGIKGLSITISLFLVPLTINYINPEKYGIWLIISSMILWFNFFDFGFGNGLRNKLTEAIASENVQECKKLISTAYASLILLSLGLVIIFLTVNPFIKWDELLKISRSYKNDLNELIPILFVLFCLQFVLQLINAINYSFQRSAMVSAVSLTGNILSLIFVILLKLTVKGSLLGLGIAVSAGNLIALLLFTFNFFVFKYPNLKPNIKYVSFESSKNILNLGRKFFIIQIAAIVQYETTNILISRYFSPVKVTEYNIAYKMFSVIMLVFGIILTPIWSAVTEAQSKGDYKWILQAEKKLLKMWSLFALLAIIILIFSKIIYFLWLKNLVIIPFMTSFGIMLYILVMSFGSIYVSILNGLGRLKTQFYLSIITMIAFIPLSYLLAIKFNLGIFGLCLALIISNFNGLIAAPIEFKKIMNENNQYPQI